MALQEVLFLILVPVAAIIIIVLYFPKYLYMTILRLQLYMAGMTPKTLTVNGFVYSYAERGVNQPGTPSFLFIHGFSASKEGWSEVIKHLPPNRHVVAIDLPGHGGSSRIELEEIHPMAQAHKIHQFARLHGLDKESFHVIGLSLGASVAACFAAAYPSHTSHVTLCCPPIPTPNDSKFKKLIDSGQVKSLLPTNVEEFDKIRKLITYKPLNFPKQIMQGVIDSRKKNQQYLQRLFKELSKPEVRKQPIENAEKIKSPTQVVWGDTDNLVDVSGVEVLKKELDNCVRTDIVKDCGHMIHLEHPKQLASLIMVLQRESQ